MDIAASYHAATEAIVAMAGGSDKLVHLNAGMAIYLGAQFLLRTRRASLRALQILFALEIANEVMDRFYYGEWRWADTVGDIVMTMLWPTVSVIVSLHRRRQWAAQEMLRRAALRGEPPVPLASRAR
jgi:hypothetical protein